jgi:hypothetical protein
MDTTIPALGDADSASAPPERHTGRLWLSLVGFLLAVGSIAASFLFLFYLFAISDGAGGIPPIPQNVDPQTQNYYLTVFGYLSLLVFLVNPIAFTISLWIIICDAADRLFYPWRLGVALLTLILSAAPTLIDVLYFVYNTMSSRG